MSDETFDFINDDEIENIIGKQEEEPSEIDQILEEVNNSEKKITEEMLDDLLSYRKDTYEEEEEEREEVMLSPMTFREFVDDDELEVDVAGLEFLHDIPIDISVVLGSVFLEIGKLSKIGVGTKIPLKKLAGEAVDVYIGDILVAKAETYVIESENTFSVMITEILSEKERLLSVYETLKKQKQI